MLIPKILFLGSLLCLIQAIELFCDTFDSITRQHYNRCGSHYNQTNSCIDSKTNPQITDATCICPKGYYHYLHRSKSNPKIKEFISCQSESFFVANNLELPAVKGQENFDASKLGFGGLKTFEHDRTRSLFFCIFIHQRFIFLK